jgi:uncharacterized protein YndB with AHSA1/START domain
MSKFITNEITIQAPMAEVWSMLIEPQNTRQYMFGCETVSEWKIGSSLIWRGMHEGKSIDFVKGFILELKPTFKFTYSVFDPHAAMEDVPENYLQVTYDLSWDGKATLLKVTQGDYDTVADGERRYTESYNNGLGWMPFLEQIKNLCEHRPVSV